MDGLEAIRILRRDKDHRSFDIPIIILTSLEVPGDKAQCLSSGANEFLSKPVSLKHLSRLIEQYLKK